MSSDVISSLHIPGKRRLRRPCFERDKTICRVSFQIPVSMKNASSSASANDAPFSESLWPTRTDVFFFVPRLRLNNDGVQNFGNSGMNSEGSQKGAAQKTLSRTKKEERCSQR